MWLGKPHPGHRGPEINWFCLWTLPSKQLPRNVAQRGSSPEGTDRLHPGWAPQVDTAPLNGAINDDRTVRGRGRLMPCLSFLYIKLVKTLGEEIQTSIGFNLEALHWPDRPPLVSYAPLASPCV